MPSFYRAMETGTQVLTLAQELLLSTEPSPHLHPWKCLRREVIAIPHSEKAAFPPEDLFFFFLPLRTFHRLHFPDFRSLFGEEKNPSALWNG